MTESAAQDPIAATRQWLERAVIGLNLCPFAKAVHVKQQVRFVLSDASTPEALLEQLAAMSPEQKKEGIYLRADKNVPYGVVTTTMAAIHRAGFEKIGMITVPAEKDK